jgi:hypothetical protein
LGNWDADVKCWMTPDGAPTRSKGTAQSKWILNGRYVQEEFTGEFMGKPFHGVSLMGYDNMKQKYTSVWVDDVSTIMYVSEGTGNAKVITLEGKMDCPMTGQKDMMMRQVFRILSPNQHIFEMHDVSKGENSKTMEITYTRKP